MKTWHWIVIVVVAVLTGITVYVMRAAHAIEVVPITDDLHMIKGFGGNVAVLKTGDGAVIVDTMTFQSQGDIIRQKAEELTGERVDVIINTHYHLDHTHGNPGFERGTKVFATQRTLEHLHFFDNEAWQEEAAEFLPTQTFTNSRILRKGNKTLILTHPGPGHTDGDLVVQFVEDNTLHTGDLLFHKHYPNIDLEAGGTVAGWPDTLDRVLALQFDHVIPGHGDITDANGIRAFQTFLTQLAAVGRRAAANGDSLETTLANADFTADAGYEPIRFIVSLGLDRPFVIQRAWEEATGAVSPQNPQAEPGLLNH